MVDQNPYRPPKTGAPAKLKVPFWFSRPLSKRVDRLSDIAMLACLMPGTLFVLAIFYQLFVAMLK